MQTQRQNGRKHRLITYIVVCLCMATAALFLHPQTAFAQETDNWEFQLQKLHVIDAQEDECYLFICGDGDEPYFIAIKLYAQYDTADTALVSWSGYLEEQWAAGVYPGDERYIPTDMGLVAFPDVQIVTRDDVLCRAMKPEGGGLLLIAMEHDGTPWATIQRIMTNLQDAINQELTNLVANASLNIYDPEPDIQAAIDRIISKILPDVWESLEIVVESGGDPDDLIGYQFVLLGAGDPRLEQELAVPNDIANTAITTFKEPNDQINLHPLVFQGNDATYEVTATLRKSSPDRDQKVIEGLTIDYTPSVLIGSTPTFTAKVDSGTRVTYDWSWSDGSSSTCDAASHAFPDFGPQSFTVRASNTWDSKSVTVTVNVVAPTASLYIPIVATGLAAE